MKTTWVRWSVAALVGLTFGIGFSGQNEASAQSPVVVDYALLFGPGPVDMQGFKYGWVIYEIHNLSGAGQVATISATVEDVPFGCERAVVLILPGQTTFSMLPYEYKFVLFRVRYEAQACATPGVYDLTVSSCVGAAGYTDCLSRDRPLIVSEPATQWRSVASPITRHWFTFCMDQCILWPVDWYYFSQHRVAFLEGVCYGVPIDTMYLKWFAHGDYIYDQRDDSRPFDVYPLAWDTTTSLGLVNLNDYTTAMSCEQWYHPPEDGLFCSSGHVGHTYPRPATFDGWARLQCVGPLGTDCLGLPLIEYTWTYQ